MGTTLETLIPLQLAGTQATRFNAERVLPGGEVPLDMPLEGVLPVVPESFSDFVNSLSGNQDDVVKGNPDFLETSSDSAGSEPVMDANAGMHQLPLLQQTDEMSIRPGLFFKDTGMVLDDVVPQPDASYGDTQPSDTKELIDPETVVNKTPAPAIVTSNPVVQVDPEQIVDTNHPVVHVPPKQRGLLSVGPDGEGTPIPHVPKESGTDNPGKQILIDSAGVRSGMPDPQGLKTAGSGVVPGLLGSPILEGAPMVSGTAPEAGQPKPLAGGNNHANLPVEGQVSSAGRDSEISQKVAMILPVLENGKDSQTDIRGRMSLALSVTSEKTSPQGSLPSMGQDVSGNFPEGRDKGYSAPFHGNKPGMLDPRFESVDPRGNTTVSSVNPEGTAPGTFQTSDPEKFLQIEKMTWSLTGPPGTAVSEKSNNQETVRLPLEPREIRTLTDIIEKAVWRQENGQSQARIQLKPAFLGHLNLNVIMDQLKVTVEIRAETLLARDFLETNLHVLKADLQESGLEIDKIDVLVDPDLNNQQEQRTSAQKQMQRMNGSLKEENTLTDTDPEEARQMISSGREENQIDCFV